MPVPDAALREAPHFRGHRWAEPRLPHLRERLREVVREREAAGVRAARARQQVLERFDRSVVAARIALRLEALTLRRGGATAGEPLAAGRRS